MVNRRIFAQPPGLAVSNFRILRRDVVDRICESRTAHPYITGQALIYSNNPADVLVRHEARPVGKSNYGLARILALVFAILFSYSLVPAAGGCTDRLRGGGGQLPPRRLLPGAGALRRHPVAGWTTIAVLLAFFNGVVIALLAMLGEYVVRTLNAVSALNTYHVTERVSS